MKENFKIINEPKEYELIQNHICLLEKTDNVINQSSSHDFHDLVACYMVNFNSKNFHSLINYESKNEEYYAPL